MSAKSIEIQGVSKRFGGLAAVNDVSLTTIAGGITGLIGPNGAGKTTTFNLITGAIRPDAGKVLFGGEDITGLPTNAVVARGLAKTFQATVLYDGLTVAENIEAALLPRIRKSLVGRISGRRHGLVNKSDIGAEVDRLLLLSELSEYADTVSGELSYGLQKKVGIMLALATKPSLLLLDEPAAGLNHKEASELGAFLKRLNSNDGIDICLVEHHMELVMSICEKVIVLVEGKKLVEGSPEAISQDPRVIDAYLGGAEIDSAQS